MKKVFTALLGLIALGALAGTASANGAAKRAAAAPAASGPVSWSGFYLGAAAGYAWSSTDWTVAPTANYYGTLGQGFDTEPDGAFGGAHVGFNMQSGIFVYGLEASFSIGRLSDKVIGVIPPFCCDQFTTNVSGLITVTGRLGYVVDRTLLYVKGGYANAEVYTSALSGPPGANVSWGVKERHDGWTVGTGFEYVLRPNWIVGLEYNFVQLDGGRHTAPLGGTGAATSFDIGDTEIHTVMARLSFKLDRDRDAAPPK